LIAHAFRQERLYYSLFFGGERGRLRHIISPSPRPHAALRTPRDIFDGFRKRSNIYGNFFDRCSPLLLCRAVGASTSILSAIITFQLIQDVSSTERVIRLCQREADETLR
jgi:hypothetical protein